MAAPAKILFVRKRSSPAGHSSEVSHPLRLAGAPRFILPDRSVLQAAADEGAKYAYGIYNYYGWGLIAAAKRRRFQRALNLASAEPAQRVIDMGAADGILLPTLSRHYQEVVAIDYDPTFVERSQQLVDATGLSNVRLLCNNGVALEALREQVGSGFSLMFLLETLEHAGSQADIWGSKIDFLNDCFALLNREGRIIISVPKMVGLIVLFKNLLQRCLRLGHDPLTFRQLFKSAFLCDTEELEPLWDGHHLGFNHLKLGQRLKAHFEIRHRSESLISVFYVLGRARRGPLAA